MSEETFDYLEAMNLFYKGIEVESIIRYRDGRLYGYSSPEDEGENNVLFHKDREYRRKPKTLTLAGIEFPEPMKTFDKYKSTQNAYLVRSHSGVVPTVIDTAEPTQDQEKWLKMGILQATERGAEAQRRAMILAVGGKP